MPVTGLLSYARAGIVLAMVLACAQCAGLQAATSTAPPAPLIPGCSVVLRAGDSVEHALSDAAPGTSICLEDGNYSPVTFKRSGAPGAWITLRAVHPGKAIFIGRGRSDHVINLNAKNYLEIRDLVVDGGSFGIVSSGFGHHTRVIGNEVRFTNASGIQLNDGDYREIAHNRVHDCAKGWSGSGSGISIYHPTAFDHSSGPHNVISYNLSYDNANPPGGTDGNGIIFDDGNHAQSDHRAYKEQSIIEENIVYGNGGAGVNVSQSSDVVVRNNTAYWNHSVTTNSATWRGELQDGFSTGIVWANNIAWANRRYNRHNSAIVTGGSGTIWRNNLEYTGWRGTNPKLANPPDDMTPLPGSPAIGAGTKAYGVPETDFYGKPWGDPIGIGAVK